VVATLAVAGGLAVINPLSRGDAPAFAATPPLIEVEYDQAAPSASEHLLSMAAKVSSVPDEHGGPVTFVRTRAWALDMASSRDEAVTAVVPYEQELWRGPDKSALVRRTWLPPQFANERARRDWERTVGQTPDGAEEVARYGPGERPTVTPEPPSGDLAELTSQLYSHQPRANGAKSAIRAVADIYRDWVLPAPVRAQVLRFLAAEAELRYRGRVTDRAGREGVAVTVDSNGETDMLIIDPRTGAVLAYENIITSSGRLPVEVPAVFSYVLILDSHNVAAMPD
jgi:hypothetical protein